MLLLLITANDHILLHLKVPSVSDAVTLDGKVFQARGAATKNARSPIVVRDEDDVTKGRRRRRSQPLVSTSATRHSSVAYYYFIETMYVCRTVSEIFSVKEWRDLQTGGTGPSRSLKMAPLDRSYTNFYWSAIVSTSVCSTIFNVI